MLYWEELWDFRAGRGLDAKLEFHDRLRRALDKQASESVLALSESDRKEFRRRVDNVLERLESIGFMTHVLEREWKENWALVRRLYSPEVSPEAWSGGTDWVGGNHDFQTARYAMEALLLFSVALCEYLARAVGVVFGENEVSKLGALREHLRQNGRFPEAAALINVLDVQESLWQELQVKGFRSRLSNIDGGPWRNATLRNAVAHCWALRVNPLQFQIWRSGSVDTQAMIEPGAAVYHDTPNSIEWGEGKGFREVCVTLRDEMRTLVADVLGTLAPDPD